MGGDFIAVTGITSPTERQTVKEVRVDGSCAVPIQGGEGQWERQMGEGREERKWEEGRAQHGKGVIGEREGRGREIFMQREIGKENSRLELSGGSYKEVVKEEMRR